MFAALQQNLATERQEYEDLTTKYEILEEEHVVTKSQLVTDKQTLERYCDSKLLKCVAKFFVSYYPMSCYTVSTGK